MTQLPDSEDAQWLDALAGKPSATADPKLNQQALAVRDALLARSRRLDNAVPQADDVQFQQLQFRLRREGLTNSHRPWHKPPAWGLAASVVLAVAVVVQMSGVLHDKDESMILRGDGQATVMIVTDPEARLAELIAGLKVTGVEPKVERLGQGRIVLKLQSTQPVLDYLETQRISPMVNDGQIVLRLSPQPSK